MAGDLIRVAQLRAYSEAEKTEPTMFLSSLFTEKKTFPTEEVECDSQRFARRVAIDRVPGTGANLNEIGRFTNKKYIPPLYDEAVAVNAFNGFQRLPGETAYDMSGSVVGRAMARLLDGQLECRRKIQRAIELMAASVFFDGVITLTFPISGSVTINFERRTELDITASVSWATTTTDALGDLETLGDLLKQYGKTVPKKLIFGTNAFKYLQLNDEYKARLDQVHRLTDVLEAPQNKGNGAIYHGNLTFGGYSAEMWTYPEGYENAAGTYTLYVPADKILMVGENPRLVTAYGGVPAWVELEERDRRLWGLTGIPTTKEGAIDPYFKVDQDRQVVFAGVRSRPLLIPVALDSYATIDVTP